MGLLIKAIEFGTVTMLLVALVVAVVFISVVAKLDLALMVAVSLLLRELQLATAQLGACRTFQQAQLPLSPLLGGELGGLLFAGA